MGWLWSSPKAQNAQGDPPKNAGETSTTLLPQPISQKLSREEQANLDFENLLKEIQIEQEAAQGSNITSQKDNQISSVPVPQDISPDSLFPTELSCRSAFDYAMFCQSFGGQFVNVYRYGQFRSCRNHWDDFWLCMRTRNWDEKDRKKAIHDHYKNKAVKWKTGRSSEDIWETRTEPVKDAFQDNLEELEAKIEEWKQSNPNASDPWSSQQGTTFSNPPPTA